MDRFARIVLGYHGCEPDFSDALISGKVGIAEWRTSRNQYDWLGHGIYFWEFAPERARIWANHGGVVGAVIQLGNCLDLSDVQFTSLIAEQFEVVRGGFEMNAIQLPQNRGGRRDLDCLVINELVKSRQASGKEAFQTVRCPFTEGEPAFAGSGILRESHVQVAVRDAACIVGVFRPSFL